MDHVLTELAPEVADIDVDHVGSGVEVVTPHVGEQQTARQHLVRVAQESLQEGELASGQLDNAPIDGGPPRAQIEGDAAGEQHRGIGGGLVTQA